MSILSDILQMILEYLLPIALTSLISYIIIKVKPFFESELARKIARIFVEAAEKIYKEADGSVKLDYVLKNVEEWLMIYNIKLDMIKLRGVVESEVYKLKEKKE